jgi:hypothetical protein
MRPRCHFPARASTFAVAAFQRLLVMVLLPVLLLHVPCTRLQTVAREK